MIARGATIEVGAGGLLEIGAGSTIGRAARLVVGSGSLSIGSGVEVGERVTVVALEGVEIHDDVVLEEMAVVIDFVAPDESVEAPLRHQPVATTPVSIGAGALVGTHAVVAAGAVIEPGVRVTPGSTVGGAA